MSYRKEATTRVLYFTAAFFASCLAASVPGILVLVLFSGLHTDTQARVAAYTSFATFAIVCGVLVYKIDKMLSKKFNKNP
jgi:biotin transporter BioY